MKDYYSVLGINSGACLKDIKQAYLKKLKKFHPDIYKGDKVLSEKWTLEINEAYDYLKNNHIETENPIKENSANVKNENKKYVSLKKIDKTAKVKTERKNFSAHKKINATIIVIVALILVLFGLLFI